MKTLFLLFTSAFTLISCTFLPADFKHYEIPLDQLIDSLNISESEISILIDKSDYKLSVLSGEMVIKEYPIVLGGNPEDDKLRQGDQCTPEGVFHINSKYPHKSWNKFIWLNYPTEDSWTKHKQAKKDGEIPEDAAIGGEIGIHGVPDNMDSLIDLGSNWTLGCIAMKNKDVDEVYTYINDNMPIIIRK